MDLIFLFMTFFLAAVIIGIAIYLLYSWNKAQQDDDEHDSSGFDIGVLDNQKHTGSKLSH